jgi:integrase
MRIYKRNGWYYFDIRIAGQRHRLALKTKDRREATTRAREAVGATFDDVPVVGVARLGEVLDPLIAGKRAKGTRESYGAKGKRLRSHFGADFNLALLSAEEIDAYLAARRAFGIGDLSLYKEISLLRQAYRAAFPSAPFPYGRLNPNYVPRKRFMTASEAARLLAVASPAARTWLLLALYAGAEPAAIPRCSWDGVDLESRYIHVPGTKGNSRDRWIPLSEVLVDHFATLDRRAPLVPGWRNRYRGLRRWCERLELERVTLTDCRRTFGSWLKQAGVDSKRVADLMGHTTTKMVDEVYGQLNAAAYREAIDLLRPLPLVAL